MPDAIPAGLTTFRLRNAGTLVLAPGTYVAFCEIPSSDRVLHVAKGMMMKAVTVTPAPGKTNADFVRWIETQDGPSPVQPNGGTTDLPPGETIAINERRPLASAVTSPHY